MPVATKAKETPMIAQATQKKTRVLILGAGVSGISTALALTNQDGWDKNFEITICQEDWRPGGKTGSGRDADDTAQCEEHGFHIILAFYSATIDLLRRTYSE